MKTGPAIASIPFAKIELTSINMDKVNYFVAAVYQRLNDKDPDTPYLNIRIIIVINIIFHQAQLIIWLKNGMHISLANTGSFLFYFFVIIGAALFYLCGLLFPRDILDEIEVREKDKFTCFRITVGYYILNFFFMMYLLMYYLPVVYRK